MAKETEINSKLFKCLNCGFECTIVDSQNLEVGIAECQNCNTKGLREVKQGANMSKETELNACQFCKSTSVQIIKRQYTSLWYSQCRNCEARGPETNRGPQKCGELWNTRHADKELVHSWCNRCGSLVVGDINHGCDKCGNHDLNYFVVDIELIELKTRHADKELVTQPYKPEDLETNRMYLVCDANDDYLVAFWVGDMWDSPERGFLKVGEVAFCVGPIKEKP